jgi:aminomethyltransferase
MQITPAENAKKVFKEILKAGEKFKIKPIGLGARDTLRLEKCFILAGNEFEGGRSPLEATLGWTINWDHDFIGKKALLKQKEKGDFERLTKMICTGKGIPRHGCEVQKNGKKVGKVSSGTLSPCLGKGIAMAYVHPEFRTVGETLEIIIRGKPVTAEIVKPPFVPKDWAEHN